MAITTPKEKPTGSGNSTAGNAINPAHFPTTAGAGKGYTTVAASLALHGLALETTTRSDDGCTHWRVTDCKDQARHFTHWHCLSGFLASLGG